MRLHILGLAALLLTISYSSYAYLAHHWHQPGSMTPVAVTVGGLTSRFNMSGTTCIATDPGGNDFDLSTAPNPSTVQYNVCTKMALKINPAATCSLDATTNLYVCTGEVTPTNCTIHSSGNLVTCN